MASRRVGIDNSSTGKAVQKASGLSNALFGGPTPQIVEEKKEEPKVEEKVEEVKEVVKEEPKKKPKKQEFDEKFEEEFEEFSKSLRRQTFFLEEQQIVQLKVYCYRNYMKVNEALRTLLDIAVPANVKEEAKEMLKDQYKKGRK